MLPRHRRHPTCGVVHYRGGGGCAPSCRFENPFVEHTTPNKDYIIDTTLHIGSHVQNSKKGQDRTIIASGGPGDGRTGCCAIGIGLNNSDGTAHAELEDWYDGNANTQCLCDDHGDGSCRRCGLAPALGSLYNKDVRLTWQVYHDQQGVHYDAYASA